MHGKNEFATNDSLKARRDEACPVGLPSKSGIYAARALGAELWDIEGKRYIDFIGGIGVLNVGHSHPKVVEAIRTQSESFIHTAFGIAQYESYVEVCEILNRVTPGDTPKKTALFNSGAEAVENSVKFARQITGRPGVIAFSGAFHGRTLLATTLTGKSKPYKVGFGPYVPAVFHAEYPDAYHGVDTAEALKSVDRLFKSTINANEVAAIIVEPVQGEGGFNPASKEFLEGLRARCDEYGIMLIADEIQSGMGRSGKYFAFEKVGVEPDFVCIAKSIAAGLPLSALTGKADLMDKVVPGSMGSTYGGNPVACAAALAVFDIIESEGLLQRAEEIGAATEKRWKELQTVIGKDVLGDVRRVGGMSAVEFVKDGDPSKPNGELAAKILIEARSRGLIMTTAGAYAQCLRSLAPLVISDVMLAEGLDIFADAAEAAVKG